MEFAASLLHFARKGVVIYLFYGDGVPRCSSDRVFLAVVFGREASIDRSTVLQLPGDSLLNPTVNRLQDYRQTRNWVCGGRDGRGFGNIPFPSANRVVSPLHSDGRDRYTDHQFGYDVSHSSSLLSTFG